MRLEQLERLAALLANRDHAPQLRYLRPEADKRGYFLDDEFIGRNRHQAFETLCDRIQARMKLEIRDMPQSKVSTRRGRGA